jgi:hypothetical protein
VKTATPAPPRFAVVVIKHDGRRIYSGEYPTRREAEDHVEALRSQGLRWCGVAVTAEIVPLRAGVIIRPGMSMPDAREAKAR